MVAFTSAANPPALAVELPLVMCRESAVIDTSPPEPMMVFWPMYAAVALDWFVVACVRPMPTNPPVSLRVVARASVTESAATLTSPVADRTAEAMYAVTFGVIVTIVELSFEPTKPPPEPVASAVETPSPGGTISVASETPPGPTSRCGPWLVSTTAPGRMSMRN